MQIRLKLITLLLAGAAATAIAAAPIAAADPAPAQPTAAASAPAAHGGPAPTRESCSTLGGSQTQCQSPGNVQIYDAPPQVNYFPLGDS